MKSSTKKNDDTFEIEEPKTVSRSQRFDAKLRVDIRTLGSENRYLLPTINISKTGLLLSADPLAIPFRQNTLVEIRIDPVQLFPNTNVALPTSGYHTNQANNSQDQGNIYFIGKIIRITENSDSSGKMEGSPTFVKYATLAIRIVQIEWSSQRLWDTLIQTHSEIVLEDIASAL